MAQVACIEQVGAFDVNVRVNLQGDKVKYVFQCEDFEAFGRA